MPAAGWDGEAHCQVPFGQVPPALTRTQLDWYGLSHRLFELHGCGLQVWPMATGVTHSLVHVVSSPKSQEKPHVWLFTPEKIPA